MSIIRSGFGAPCRKFALAISHALQKTRKQVTCSAPHSPSSYEISFKQCSASFVFILGSVLIVMDVSDSWETRSLETHREKRLSSLVSAYVHPEFFCSFNVRSDKLLKRSDLHGVPRTCDELLADAWMSAQRFHMLT